jgi:LPXTG-site transpeptidase (sortase) family protein
MKRNKERLQNIFIAIEGLVIFTILFLSIMIFANWDAVANEVRYTTTAKTIPTPTPSSTPTVATPPTPAPIDEPAHIIIDKIKVDSPIQWNIPVDATVDALNHGVAHLDGSANLGEIGNLFLTGHSSDYYWKKNPYAAIFSLLPKLAIGDTFMIRENGSEYIYRVNETKIVNPNQVEVAAPTTNSIATLMTCYPIGSTRQRFIVRADLISNPALTDKKAPSSTQTLPEIRFR